MCIPAAWLSLLSSDSCSGVSFVKSDFHLISSVQVVLVQHFFTFQCYVCYPYHPFGSSLFTFAQTNFAPSDTVAIALSVALATSNVMANSGNYTLNK